MSDDDTTLSPTKRALLALKDMSARLEALQEPVALVGMSCRLPGAASPDELWRMLVDGIDAITTVPAERWPIDRLYSPDRGVPGSISARCGGFLRELDRFDAAFFGISPREAPHVDPRQRLLLELAWEALEDAGIPPDSLAGTPAGVFVSTLTNDYDQLLSRDNTLFEIYTGTGTANAIVANRISYVFDLRGPSVALDTACSGSLVAIHLACQSLRSGESTLALAGGVSLNLLPNGDVFFSRAGSLSPDGRCRTFDRGASGIVRSEGAAVVALKLLSRALADGDRIHAVLRGSAVNHDGRSNGIMAPSGQAQRQVLRRAYAQAGVAPAQVQYVEAHGTGTPVGDPIEVEALIDVLGEGRPADRPCVLGSLKTNLGHTEATAGVAGLLKVALALENGRIPGNLHLRELNPLIPAAPFPLEVRRAAGPWPDPDAAGPRIAGVSAFGFGGTNSHLVVEAAPELPARAPASSTQSAPSGPWLLPLSARHPEALRGMAEAWRQRLRAPDAAPDAGKVLGDLCWTAAVRRTHHDQRLAVAFRSAEEGAALLTAWLEGDELPAALSQGVRPEGLETQDEPVVFVFSGQGSHWLGMGRGLLDQRATEPAFRAALEDCDRVLAELAGWSLLAELAADEVSSRLEEIDVAQPAIFAIQVALAALWRSRGVEPAAVVGQSLGEVAAAHVAGILSLEDAALLVHHRSRLLRRTVGQGKTAAVGLSPEEAERAIAGFESELAVAGSTGPTSCILSGTPAAVAEVAARLEAQGAFCRILENVDTAAHSPLMEPLRGELAEALREIRPRPGTVPFISTVTAAPADGASLDPAYWASNLREPFRFAEAIRYLSDQGFSTFLELSAHPLLTGQIRKCLSHLDRTGDAIPSLRRQEDEPLGILSALGAVWCRGGRVDWRRLFSEGAEERRVVAAPTYAWRRERHWIDMIPGALPPGERRRSGDHPLLGERRESPRPGGGDSWEVDLDAWRLHYLADHRVQETVLLPGAAFLEMALAAADAAGPSFFLDADLEDVVFERGLLFPEREIRRVQTVLAPAGGPAVEVEVYSRPLRAGASGEPWTRHAVGRLRRGSRSEAPEAEPLEAIRARCPETISAGEHYAAMQQRGLRYGPKFQAVQEVRRGAGESLGRLQLPAELAGEAGRYVVHPVLLDAAFQAVASTLSPDDPTTYLPQGVRALRLHGPASDGAWCHVRVHADAQPGAERLEADVRLLAEDGRPLLDVEGLRLQRLDAPVRSAVDDWLYEPHWQPADRPAGAGEARERPAGSWLLLDDGEGFAATLAASLEARGERCTIRPAGEGGDVSGGPLGGVRGVVHLAGLRPGPDASASRTELDEAIARTGLAALGLAQSLAAAPTPFPRLWLITRGAQAVTDGEAVPGLDGAPLWGFGRALAQERSELFGGLIDLDPAEPPELAAERLCDELLAPDEESQVAFRGGARHVLRLRRLSTPAASPEPVRFRPDGAYLVTGGLDGLGLEVARWMVGRGARRLLLLARTPLPERTAWRDLDPSHPARRRVNAVRELEALGAAVHVGAVDVGDEAALAAFLDDYDRQALPPLRGVVHSAGLIRDQLLHQMDAGRFREVLVPKIHGAWNLHRLTRERPVELFVLFSSLSSMLGQVGQCNYAAGNAFLDALAHHRRALGLPAVAVHWGPWSDVGIFARLGDKIELRGLRPFHPEQGLLALEKILAADPPEVVALDADWREIRGGTLIEELVAGEAALTGHDGAEDGGAVLELLLATPEERVPALEAYLRASAARILRTDPEKLPVRRPLTTLGMDSIMAVELKNQIVSALHLEVPMVDLFTGSVSQLAESLASRMDEDPALSALLAEVEEMPMDQVEALLSEEGAG